MEFKQIISDYNNYEGFYTVLYDIFVFGIF
jgi:hypothetical protein